MLNQLLLLIDMAGSLGNESLAILYCTVAVSVFLAPAIVNRCGEKWTMIVGGLCYIVIQFTSPTPLSPLLKDEHNNTNAHDLFWIV